MDPLDTRTEGEKRRDAGTAIAAANRPAKTAALQLRILEQIVRDGSTTIDDVTDAELNQTGFADRGPWRGAAIIGLSRRKLIRQTGERRRSVRATRHAGANPVWCAAVDPLTIQAAIEALRADLQTD